MPCPCHSGESLDIFGERGARRELRRYLRNGLGGRDARQIAAWTEEAGLEGRSVLEVGGGIGQLQAELLRRGAASGRVVEVVGAYESLAGELAEAVGVADRSAFVLADLLEDPEAVASADVVILRRVVCCSPKGPELLRRAAVRTQGSLFASYPRERVLVRAMLRLSNVGFRLFRKRYRAFVHPVVALDAAAAREGLRRSRVARGLFWETAQFDARSAL